MLYKNIAGRFFGLVTKHACDRRTDRQTDGQNYDSQDRASIAASRGKNDIIKNFRNVNKWSQEFDVKPHRRRTTVQSYSPGGANVLFHLVHPIGIRIVPVLPHAESFLGDRAKSFLGDRL